MNRRIPSRMTHPKFHGKEKARPGSYTDGTMISVAYSKGSEVGYGFCIGGEPNGTARYPGQQFHNRESLMR